MESDSALHGDVPDGAEVSPSVEDEQEAIAEISENNVTSNEASAALGIIYNNNQIFIIITIFSTLFHCCMLHYFHLLECLLDRYRLTFCRCI